MTKRGVVAIVKVVKLSNKIIQNDIRIALLGGSNNGKTTFLSVIQEIFLTMEMVVDERVFFVMIMRRSMEKHPVLSMS